MVLVLAAFPAQSQDVLRLEPGQAPASATLADVAWLAGHWVGTGLGGDCDETWLPATDNAMPGIFRYHRGDTLLVRLAMRTANGSTIEEFRFQRKPL